MAERTGRYLAIVPARGGSKGVPRKNIRPLAGLPLIEYSIVAALGAKRIDRCVVSTDDNEIAAIAAAAGAEVVMRPQELAADETPTLPVLVHVVDHLKRAEDYRCDAVLTLQPTSPLRTSRHIDEAIARFDADPEADSLVSCVEVPHNFTPLSVMIRDKNGYLRPYLNGPQALRRQDKEAVFARNGAAIYITRTDRLSSFIFGGNLLAYMMSPADSLDIDSEADFLTAEIALRARQ